MDDAHSRVNQSDERCEVEEGTCSGRGAGYRDDQDGHSEGEGSGQLEALERAEIDLASELESDRVDEGEGRVRSDPVRLRQNCVAVTRLMRWRRTKKVSFA